MTDTLTSRVTRIISGNLHSLIKRMENATPEAVMEQCIREIDQATDDIRVELGKILAMKHNVTKQLAGKNHQHETLHEQINFALNEQREDLAQAAISKQLDIEAQIPVLENTLHSAAEREKQYEGYIAALLAKKHEMHEELRAFALQRKEINATGNGEVYDTGVQTKVDKAKSVFDRIMQSQTGMHITSLVDKTSAMQLVELEALARQNRIQERLSARKSSLATVNLSEQ